MNFTPKMLLNLMFNTHVQVTRSNNPITYHKFLLNDINYTLYYNKNSINKIANHIYSKYKLEPESKLKGSVDINPNIWVEFYLKNMIDNNGNVPNGCCNTDNCGIKKFYYLIDVYIKKLDQVIWWASEGKEGSVPGNKIIVESKQYKSKT